MQSTKLILAMTDSVCLSVTVRYGIISKWLKIIRSCALHCKITPWLYFPAAKFKREHRQRGSRISGGRKKTQFSAIWYIAGSQKQCKIKSFFVQHFLTQSVRLSEIIAWKVTNYHHAHTISGNNVGQWLVSGKINFFYRYLKKFLGEQSHKVIHFAIICKPARDQSLIHTEHWLYYTLAAWIAE